MTTPNEELINNLTIKAGVMEMGEKIAWGSDTALMRQAAATLQSQAERIAELEREVYKAADLAMQDQCGQYQEEIRTLREKYNDTYGALDDAARENTSLRARLAAIENTEPVLVVEKEPDYWSGGHFHEGSKSHIGSTKVWRLPIGTKLFTRPMPAQNVTELVEALEEYGRAGVGNSTDWRVQLSALRLASTALSKYKGAK